MIVIVYEARRFQEEQKGKAERIGRQGKRNLIISKGAKKV